MELILSFVFVVLVLIVLICAVTALFMTPVYLITGWIDQRKAATMPMEERAAFLASRTGLRRFRPNVRTVETVGQTNMVGDNKRRSAIGGLIATPLLILVIWFCLNWGNKASVASDFVQQYEIAKRNGSAMDRCVQAGLVKTAFLQAHDESQYQEWNDIQRLDCIDAGVPTSP